LAVSTNSTEAQVFLEALEQGLDGVILKVEDMDDIIKLKKERGKEPVNVDKGYCVKG
jgi:3-dehydroquinate synthase class II